MSLFEDEMLDTVTPAELKTLKQILSFVVTRAVPGAKLGQVLTVKNKSVSSSAVTYDLARKLALRVREVVNGELTQKLKLDDEGGSDEAENLPEAAE